MLAALSGILKSNNNDKIKKKIIYGGFCDSNGNWINRIKYIHLEKREWPEEKFMLKVLVHVRG